MNRTRFDEALLWASELHEGQIRKGRPVPYVFHLMSVAALVAEYGGDEDQCVAALLHDAIEDAGGPVVREEIRRRFGDVVVAIVDGCTDTDQVPKPPWRERKEAYVANVRNEPPEVRLVSAADKLHNTRCLEADLRREGTTPEGEAALWARYRGGKDGTLWYYEAVARVLGDGWSHAIVEELARTVQRVVKLAARSETPCDSSASP